MNKIRTEYDDKVKLTCVENDQELDAEVLDYQPAYQLTCSVNRQVKVYLRYNNSNKKYVGNVGSLEFVCDGPKKTVIKQGR